MARTHDDKDRDESEEVIISPLILESVKVRTKIKEIISPVLVPVEVERPVFIDQEYERPILVDKEYERPVLIDKNYERPVITNTAVERPIITDVKYERPVLIDIEYEKPVIIEKEYKIPVPKEVPYDVPIVSLKQVTAMAELLTTVLVNAKTMIDDLNEAKKDLVKTINRVKEAIPKEIIMPNIIYEDYTVKNVTIEEETVTVIGKIIARGK